LPAERLQVISIDDVELVHSVLAAQYRESTAPIGKWTRHAEDGWRGLLGSVENMVAYGKYDTVALATAALLRHGAMTQYFEDGNKRIATACAEMQLVENGFKLSASVPELIEFIDFVISWSQDGGDVDVVVESVAGWIDSNIEPA
jgi:prophage maintenance system killer protein